MKEQDLQETFEIAKQYPTACTLLKHLGVTVESLYEGVTTLLNDELLDDDDFRYEAGQYTLSDFMCKKLKAMAKKDMPDLTKSELALLMSQAGLDEDGHGYDDDFEWNDDMISKYAEHLKNYLYTYKESATEIDSSIDPNEEHVGPMAQDIEKVAPDCVKETPEGVKVVDGNRLALVNAGVIGDLARRLLHLEEVANA